MENILEDNVELYTGCYGDLDADLSKDMFFVSVSNGDLHRYLKEAYGEKKGNEYFEKIHLQVGSKLGPTQKIYSDYSNSQLPQKFKEENYYNDFLDYVLGKIDFKKEIEEIARQAKEAGFDEVILLCYESPDEFCHRHILAEKILQEFGVEVPEFSVYSTERELGRIVFKEGEWNFTRSVFFNFF